MSDQELLIEVKKNGMLLENASEAQKNIKNIVLTAVCQNGVALKFASTELKNDIDIVKAAVIKKGSALYFASDDLKNNKEVILLAVGKDGIALEHTTKEFKKNRDVVLVAVKKNGLALEFASDKLRDDEELVLLAVSSKGKSLKFASSNLKKDKHIVEAAVKQNRLAFQFADDNLKNDSDIALLAIDGFGGDSVLKNVSKRLMDNRLFISDAYKVNYHILKFASDSIRGDKKFIIELFTKNHHPQLKYVSEQLKSDEDLATLCLIKSTTSIWDISYKLLHNKEFIKKIISNEKIIKHHGVWFASRVLKSSTYIVQNDEEILNIYNSLATKKDK
ncbi:hypothetical protein GCM10022389_19550 [Flavobacterium cheonanense]|uniref:DUF4116 domain-containing protein n=1 Tax=Flavobacterium cheonanense TaxID=706183 RepID=A0ABP7VUE4_9FLAO